MKGQGISLNVIVVAAIALLVLVILSVIFVGRIGTFGEKAADCEQKGGKCIAGVVCRGDAGEKWIKFTDGKCDQSDGAYVCCIRVEWKHRAFP